MVNFKRYSRAISGLSESKNLAWFRHRTFHERNLIRIEADPNCWFRPAELIQTPILIAPELRSKGENSVKPAYKIHYDNFALGSIHEKFGVWIKAVPNSLQRRNSRPG